MINTLPSCILTLFIAAILSKHATIEATRTVEIRVDKVNALRYQPPQTTCCFTVQCACSSRMQACLFDHVTGTCPDGDLRTGPEMGGLAVGRTKSLLFLDTKLSQDKQNLGLRVVFLYGPETSQNQSVLGHYRLDIKGLPLGPNTDEVGWTTYDLDTAPGVTATLQVKMYCAGGHFGRECSRRCVPVPNQFYCSQEGVRKCLGLWSGQDCDKLDPCLSYPCLNAGTCHRTQGAGFTCQCDPLYTGKDCSMGINSCATQPCYHKGTCIDLVDGFRCMCPMDRTGLRCETEISDCRLYGCQNNGRCHRNLVRRAFECLCLLGYSGDRCQISVCDATTCQHGGRCLIIGRDSFRCRCISGFTGNRCEKRASPCASTPCQNGGKCTFDDDGQFACQCRNTGYKGARCHIRDSCASTPCGNNGICQSDPTSESFICKCLPSFSGQFCTVQDLCFSNPCHNGGVCSMVSGSDRGNVKLNCICQQGYSGRLCEIVDPCSSNPCLNGGECLSGGEDSSLPFTCSCRAGHTGYTCDVRDVCSGSNPCRNGGSCVLNNRGQGYFCQCASGYRGQNCGVVSRCFSNPCFNGGSCRDSPSSDVSYTCTCPTGIFGNRCELTQYSSNPCSSFPNPCGENGQCRLCNAGDRNCGSPPDRNFVCTCSYGYTGPLCDERNACLTDSKACSNGGVCIPLNGTYTCLCPSGERSKNCREWIDPCVSNPCLNNGVCTYILSTRVVYSSIRNRRERHYYTCACPPGFTGKNCDLIDNCFMSPCFNGGICMSKTFGSQVDVGCKCLQGYTGTRCESKLSCREFPCQNNGKCVSSYISPSQKTTMCICAHGFSGDFCDIGPDCRKKYCLNKGMCVDNSRNGGMYCQCPGEFIGKRCETRITCKDVTCMNGGTCQIAGGLRRGAMLFGSTRMDFVHGPLVSTSGCVCLPGFTGMRCEVLFNPLTRGVDNAGPCVYNHCRNGGRCVRDGGKERCECLLGWAGQNCHIWEGRRGLCQGHHCSDRGVCYQGNDNKPACHCHRGFGRQCEHSCGSQTMGDLFPHPTDCSQYIMCVWDIPYAMRCPRKGLHFNPRLGLCDWSSRAGCDGDVGVGETEYRGLWWKIEV